MALKKHRLLPETIYVVSQTALAVYYCLCVVEMVACFSGKSIIYIQLSM